MEKPPPQRDRKRTTTKNTKKSQVVACYLLLQRTREDNKVKRILTFILAIALCLTLLPPAAMAATSGDYEYRILPDSTAEITGYTGSGSNVVIPDTLGGYRVTSIGRYAFSCYDLTSVIIPEGVTSIGAGAFAECFDLISVTIPSTVARIGSHAFLWTAWFMEQTEDFVVVGDGVLIKYNGTNTAVSIPDTVTYISDAFFFNDYIESVTIPSGVIGIGDLAFRSCGNLIDITIPNSVTYIGYEAFSGCHSLTGIIIPGGVTSIMEDTFWCCCSLTSVTISEGVTSIGGFAFLMCDSLKSITIPSSVLSIEWIAFSGCSNLAEVYFEGRPPEMEEDVFRYTDPDLILYYPSSLTTAWSPNGETTWEGYKIAPYEPISRKRGDADCNGAVNAADAAAILRHLVRLSTLTTQGLINAKVTDGPGPVSAADAAKILRYLVRLEKTL